MMDAAESPQEYKFGNHEFKDANPKQSGGYTFKLAVHKGRPSGIIKSPVAKDLLAILQQSMKASELTETAIFNFHMDKTFTLHISKEVVEEEEEVQA